MLQMNFPKDLGQIHDLSMLMMKLSTECMKTHPFISKDELDVPSF
jgi:hypothetical protein